MLKIKPEKFIIPPNNKPKPAIISQIITKNHTTFGRPYNSAIYGSNGSLSKPCCIKTIAKGIRINQLAPLNSGNFSLIILT